MPNDFFLIPAEPRDFKAGEPFGAVGFIWLRTSLTLDFSVAMRVTLASKTNFVLQKESRQQP
jgi:hypothetical protein